MFIHEQTYLCIYKHLYAMSILNVYIYTTYGVYIYCIFVLNVRMKKLSKKNQHHQIGGAKNYYSISFAMVVWMS